MLEDDFILVQAELLIPCSLLPRNIPYKYIVVKANSEYSFEHLVGLGNFTNRCLLIPKERCKAGGARLYFLLHFLVCKFSFTNLRHITDFEKQRIRQPLRRY